jgi:Fe-S-cluster containining protein
VSRGRDILIQAMDELNEQKKDCSSCTGLCCTFAKNSMRITPLEAIEIYDDLVSHERWNDELTKHLDKVIKEFRLDSTILVGKRHTFRRTYTCPFFKHSSLGCSLSPKIKPYGCLAFNATEMHVKDGESCQSDHELLSKRDEINEDYESQKNSELRSRASLLWDKESIPVALLSIAKVRHLL